MATKALKSVAPTVQDDEAWRPALIAFYEVESPWMSQTLESLRGGYPFTRDNRRVIDAIKAAQRLAA